MLEYTKGYDLVVYMGYNSHDGDVISAIGITTAEAQEEVRNYLKSAKAHLAPGRGLLNNPFTDPVKRVILNMTGDYNG